MSSENIEKFIRYRFRPLDFAIEVVGLTPTNQQVEGFEAVGRLVIAKYKVWELEKNPNSPIKLSAEEQETAKMMGVSIMAGKGVGKDTFVAVLTLWFLVCFPRAKIPITGPSYDQLKDIYMKEVSKWHDNRNEAGEQICLCHDDIHIGAENIERIDSDKKVRSFAHIRTASPGSNETQQAAVLGGWHETYMMPIVDEASGVPEGVLKALENTLTRPINFAVIIFNPDRSNGFAYETHYGTRASKWIRLQWDARKSNFVTEQQLANMLEIYGADGPEYRVYVLGLPPEENPNSLIPRSWVMESEDRWQNSKEYDVENEPISMGIDPAREGKDKTVLLSLKGRRVIDITEWQEPDSSVLADKILMKISELNPNMVYIDTIGIGGPIYDNLKRYCKVIRAVNVARASDEPDRFPRLRDKAFWSLRMMFEKGLIDIMPQKQLRNELSAIRYETLVGKVKVESKEAMRKRSMPSPNHADALMLATRANMTSLRYSNNHSEDEELEQEIKNLVHSWMGR